MYQVLLVEDDTAMRLLYTKMKSWTECGFQIAEQASNGKHALEALEKRSFDLVFTDVRMPFIDGIELLREIKQRGIQTNVIFSSSYDEFEYARQGLILGAFDYILKPVDERKLENVLTRMKEKLIADTPQETIEPAIQEILDNMQLSTDSKFVHQIADYFSANYGKIVYMEDMADSFELSKDYFGKMFKQQMGCTFNYFYSLVRIAYAKDLIRTGNYKAYQISEILGYSSTDYFTKIFKEMTGMTPSAYKASLDKR